MGPSTTAVASRFPRVAKPAGTGGTGLRLVPPPQPGAAWKRRLALRHAQQVDRLYKALVAVGAVALVLCSR